MGSYQSSEGRMHRDYEEWFRKFQVRILGGCEPGEVRDMFDEAYAMGQQSQSNLDANLRRNSGL